MQSVKRCYSLKRNKEFRRTYRSGKSAGSKSMVLLHAPRRAGEVRIGFSVGKKIGNAVVRNRTKRRLREAFTPLIPCVRKGTSLVFIAKPPILDESFVSLRSTLRYLLKKAGLYVPPQEEASDDATGGASS